MSESIIDKMARLVLENPAITVKEMAAKLQYSQEKSIYYWLEKADYRGIKEFKEAVFRGYYGGGDTSETKPSDTRTVPLVEWKALAGNDDIRVQAEARGQVIAIPSEIDPGRDAFAVRSHDDKPPCFYRGDLLIVSPSQTPGDGDLVLAKVGSGLEIARLYGRKSPLLADPATGRPFTGKARVLGKIVHLIRSF